MISENGAAASNADVMVGQCLDRRIPDKATLIKEIGGWKRRRNAEKARIEWMFTVDRARTKLGRASQRYLGVVRILVDDPVEFVGTGEPALRSRSAP